MVVFNTLGSQKNPMEANYWLSGASVNGKKVSCNGDVKNFILKLEEMGAKLAASDLSWMNSLCQTIFGRDYTVVQKFESTKIEIGVGANVANNNLSIDIKKMASWPAENPRRIYVDCMVDGQEFHYYINLTGKQGRYAKDGNTSYSFSNFISKECEFLGVESEKQVLAFRGTKGYYKKTA